MDLEVGTITEGRITGIAKFGAFVEVANGVTGLVHISEISKNFVTDISKFLDVGDMVKVKILNVRDGKLSLSIKQVQELVLKERFNKKDEIKIATRQPQPPKEMTQKKDAPLTFEEMLSKFKKSSEEKMSDIRKNLDNKRNSYSRRR